MLTVKIIHPSGSESVFQAQHIILEPESPTLRKRLDFYDDKFETIVIGGLGFLEYGSVFVMNDLGKTVAVYHLGCPTPNTEPEHRPGCAIWKAGNKYCTCKQTTTTGD